MSGVVVVPGVIVVIGMPGVAVALVVIVKISVGVIRADATRGVIVHHQESPFFAPTTTEYPQGVFHR